MLEYFVCMGVFILGLGLCFYFIAIMGSKTKGKSKIIKLKKGKRKIKMWECKSWGNTVAWHNFEERRLVGWLSKKPEKGDYVFGCLSSGDVFVWKLKCVEPQQNPRDMFFADAKDIGYLQS